MIYLQEENFPLNEAFSSEIVQEANSTYQLTFKFPTSDPKWALLTPETELIADDLHGEQYFTIFEVEKQHGYVTVYANQVATLLNGYSINKINVDRVNGATVMNALVAGFKRETPFTFFSDVMSKHTLNLKDISAMEALAKDKHSIVGQWGGDLVRDKYSVRLLEHGGIENESLFAYKKNMKSFQESKSTKELRTRIHFKKVIEAHEEGKKDQTLTVTIDSPLINKYKHIYEADMEVQDQDVVDQKTLEDYGKRYFRETLCDMIEESFEIDVVGQADQPVHMFDIVSVFHEDYDVDLRKKITKYKFNPMSIKLVSIGFGEVARTLADSISGMVNDSVDKKMKSFDAEYEAKVQKLVDNANAEYDKQSKELEHKITDGIEQAKALAEVVKQEISGSIDQKIAEANTTNKNEIKEEFNAKYGDITVEMDQIKSTAELLKSNGEEIKGIIENLNIDFSTKLFNIQGEQARYKTETDKSIADLIKVSGGKADRAYVEQTAKGLKEQFSSFTFSGGPNLIRNSGYKDGLKYFYCTANRFRLGTHPFYYNGSKPIAIIFNDSTNEVLYQTNRFDLERNTDYVLNFRGFNNSSLTSCEVFVLGRKKDETQNYTVIKHLLKPTKLSVQGVEDVSLTFNSGEIDNAYVRFDNNGSSGGQADLYIAEIDLYKGTNKRPWQPAPEDQEYIVTQAQASFERTAQGLTQKVTALETSADGLASKIAEYKQTADGQFATITSQLGDMLKKTDINITDGRISFGTGKSIDGRTISSLLVQEPEAIALIAKLIKVNGDMVVDGSILGRHIASESVETGHMKAGSVTTQIIASNAVTADKLLVDSAMINKLVTNQAFIRELMAQKAFITQLASIDISANRFTGDRIQSSDGSLLFDLVKNQLTVSSNTAAIVREDAGYPTHFIRYESSIEQNQKHSRTIIGSNRNGSKNWNSVSFAGVVIDNNSNNGVDKIFQYGDYNHMRHASGDDGWNFSVVTQTLTPGIWKKNSEIWCRHFVIPKKTKSDTDSPTEFIRLDESVAALWKLWAHALGQINMTGAMKAKVKSMLDTFSYNRDHII
ncbi:phage tail spike protein [Streptococcus parasanguinis]|uniref:phage tail spike protein n=1 Tax=Streptococcus parasanguinis TaxID=1318 RepID=UPI0039C4C8C5